KQVELLKDHADLPADGFDVLQVAGELDAVHHDAALLVLLQPVEGADKGRLPEPEGPQMTTFSPRRISTEIPRSTWKSPNHLCTSSQMMMGSAAWVTAAPAPPSAGRLAGQIGRASCRERVEVPVDGRAVKDKQKQP